MKKTRKNTLYKQIKKRLNRGLTLIELLVVIAIIGLLAITAIGFLNPFEQLSKAADSKKRQELYNIRSAVMLYYESHNKYPEKSYLDNLFNTAWSSSGQIYMSRVPQTKECNTNPVLCYHYITDTSLMPQWNILAVKLARAPLPNQRCNEELFDACVQPVVKDTEREKWFCYVTGEPSCTPQATSPSLPSTNIVVLPTPTNTPTNTPTPTPTIVATLPLEIEDNDPTNYCTLPAQPGRTIIDFNSLPIRRTTMATAAESFSYIRKSLPITIQSGTYKVTLVSWDHHSYYRKHDPGNVQNQKDERWFLKLMNGSTELVRTPSSIDIPENKDLQVTELPGTITLSQNATAAVATNTTWPCWDSCYKSEDDINSVFPICAALDRL